MTVLLTNDDGIDSPGLRALYESLSAVADVTVVAPKTDQSGVGRARSDMGESRSNDVAISDHEWGYVVEGTPADCAAIGLRGIPEADEIDLVVSGCNHGPNVGSYLMGHSGTVGAVVESVFLGTPGIAVSAYDPSGYYPSDDGYDPAGSVTGRLIAALLESDLFEHSLDLLNVNVPSESPGRMRLTKPLADYETTVTEAGPGTFDSSYWAAEPTAGDRWEPALPDYCGVYPEGTDRASVVAGEISITPFEAPQTAVDAPPQLVDVVTAYNANPVEPNL